MSVELLSHQFAEFYDKISSWEYSIVKESGLSPAQMHTVEVIGHHQNMRMKELAERLGVTTGTLTVGVDKLEKMGLVERKPHKKDRRSWLIVNSITGFIRSLPVKYPVIFQSMKSRRFQSFSESF